MAYHKLTLNFNAGELSPFLNSRLDIAKYESGCSQLENFIILPYGGVMRRPGTQFIGETKFADKRARLIGFNFSVTTNFILEFGEKYIRFWTNGVQVLQPVIHANWVTGTFYEVNDRVRQGGFIYRCRINHTAAPLFETDLNDDKWEKEESTVNPLKWQPKTNYVVNQRVKYNGTILNCLVAHLSAKAIRTDIEAGRWEKLPQETTAPKWMTGVPYNVGNFVLRVKPAAVLGTFKCLVNHISGVFPTDLAAGKWVQEDLPPAPPPAILEQITPYLEGDLREIQYSQINDLMYIVHPNYPPAKLSRRADDDWFYEEITWKWPPTLQENVTATTIDPSASTGSITLVASANLWDPGHVGSYWQIGIHRDLASSSVLLGVTSAVGSQLHVRGTWSFTTYGSWQGSVFVEKLMKDGTWDVLRSWTNGAVGQRNISSSGTETDAATLRTRFETAGVAGTSNPEARLEVGSNLQYGLVKITAVADPTHASATVIKSLPTVKKTTIWSEGAFSTFQGFPRTVCLHETRLVFGGTKKRPLSLHGSAIDDFEDFFQGALADSSFFFTISANESNPIQWLVTQTKLLIGTAGNEWAIGGQNAEQAMGPGNVNAKQQSSFGSAYLQARVVNEVVLFAQRQSKKMREFVFSFEKDGWVAPDLCILAAHIAEDGFVETAFAAQPDAIFWAITPAGRLVGMTYERDQNVVGWHRHSTQGDFESVATIYGGENADEVWLVVSRTVNGEEKRYIERFDPSFRPVFEDENKDFYWYLDCGQRTVINAGEETQVTGLEHLEGLTVGILGDGANQPERVVTDGTVDLQYPVERVVCVGLPYTSVLRPMNLNIATQDTMQGRKVRIHELTVRMQKTLTMEFSSDGEAWDEIFFRDRADPMDASPPAFSGDKKVSTGATFSTQQMITIRQDRPLPCCVLAMIMWCDFYGQ